ncbi:MAG: hypothetical protein OHK0021_05050 [Bryobacter sp.]
MVEGWNWPVKAFLLAYVLFFAVGMAYVLIARNGSHWTYKLAVALALAGGFVLIWSSMVRASETDNPVNLIYLAVPLVGAAGAAWARLKARGMAWAMYAMAIAMLATLLLKQIVLADTTAGPLRNLFVGRGCFVALFAKAGRLFRFAGNQTPQYP